MDTYRHSCLYGRVSERKRHPSDLSDERWALDRGLVIAVVVLVASAHENAAGIALLDKAAASTPAVTAALMGQGFVSRMAAEATARGSSRCDTRPTGRASDMRDGLWSAPRRIRTFAPGSGGQCSIP